MKRARVFSHNDEEHGDEALTLALGQQVGTIEIDTWLWEVQGTMTLLAAHMEEEIKADKTFKGLYLDPIMEILDRHNPDGTLSGWKGLYSDSPDAEVSLAIDVKNRPEEMWPHLLEAFAPFHDKGYLTTYDASTKRWARGPLRIIGTGDTPLHLVRGASPRLIFLDAKLHDLCPPPGYSPPPLDVDCTIAPMASGWFLPRWVEWVQAGHRDKALREMKAQAEAMEARGIESRWWGAPRDPEIRRELWELQLDAGVDWLSGDDLAEMTELLRERDSRR